MATQIGQRQAIREVVFGLPCIKRLISAIVRVDERLDLAQIRVERIGCRIAIQKTSQDRQTTTKRCSCVQTVI